MGANSKIEWTDASWNPIRARNRATGKVGHHCEHVSAACVGCYAEGMNRWRGTGLAFRRQDRDAVEIFLDEDKLLDPLKWKRGRKIFVCSMTDLFAEFVEDVWINQVFAIAALAPRHTFQFLTKRPERMRAWFAREDQAQRVRLTALLLSGAAVTPPWPLPNVWLGVTAEDQATADERIPLLLDTPAAIRFISAEPLVEALDLAPRADSTYRLLSQWYSKDGFDPTGSQPERTRMRGFFPPLDWVIAGGESGQRARPSHPDWFRSLRDQCTAAGVPFFFKQWGNCLPADWDGEDYVGKMAYLIDEDHCSIDYDNLGRARRVQAHGMEFARFPHKNTGRQLDGREWSEFPKVAP